MKSHIFQTGSLVTFFGALMLLNVHQMSAQPLTKVTPTGEGRYTINVPRTSLESAVEAIYHAVGAVNYRVDVAARNVMVPSTTFINTDWHAAVRDLAERQGFTVREKGTSCIIELKKVSSPPVVPLPPRNSSTPPLLVGTSAIPTSSTTTGTSETSDKAPIAPPLVPAEFLASTPSVFTPRFSTPSSGPGTILGLTNAQTLPDVGGNSNNTEENTLQPPIYVRSVYVGGIARLFQNSGIIPSQVFVSPMMGGFGGMGMGGMGMGGMGMGGMGMGGMGMGGMGMGGMGMGGMGMGGFGGMGGMGMGGFGGMGGMGGMGMGGFGGMGGMGMGGFGRRF